MFSTRLENFLPFSSSLNLSSANSFSLEESKICRLGKGQVTFILLSTKVFNLDHSKSFSFGKELPDMISTNINEQASKQLLLSDVKQSLFTKLPFPS